MFKALVLVGVLAFLFGCSRGTISSDPLDHSLNQVYWAVESSMSMGIQKYSENKRDITSRPFAVVQSAVAKKKNTHERGRAIVTILGQERPYTLEVVVEIERSEPDNNQEYSVIRYDEGLANKLLKDILAAIQKADRTKNVIDDFKSF